jgi:diguanylate cyclase (GGDEF)-like protein/PAS domain S-box-containing protein
VTRDDSASDADGPSAVGGEPARELGRAAEHGFETLISRSPEVFGVVTADGLIAYANPAAEQLLRRPQQELVGTHVSALVHPDDVARVEARLAAYAADVAGCGDESRKGYLRLAGSESRWVEATVRCIDPRDATAGFAVTLHDVTERRRAEALVAAHSAVLELIARDAPLRETLTAVCRRVEAILRDTICSVMLTAPDREVLLLAAGPSMPEAVVEALVPGLPIAYGEGACGTAAFLRELVVVDDVSTDPVFAAWRDVAEQNNLLACWSKPVISATRGDVVGTFALYYRHRRRPNEQEIGVLDSFADLVGIAVERKRHQDELAHEALHDPLTGVPNRALLMDRLAHALQQLARRPGMVAVLFCDLDRFKVINDSLGHDVGDRVLIAAAERLQRSLRAGDTAARFGGDEFVILCEGVEGKHHLANLARRVMDVFAEPFVVDGSSIRLTCSIGISVATAPEASEVLLRDADLAMYRAKTHGKARFELFDADMRREVVRRMEVEHALYRAIDERQLTVFYQPEVRLSDGVIVGVEALVRWQHPEWGLLNPAQFIDVAEETGAIRNLGRIVLEDAVRQAATWRASLGERPLTVSVNLSPRQLSDPSLVDEVRDLIAATGVDPGVLRLELTEGALLDDVDAATGTLERLHDLGVQLALDDFGTGYSSLGYLKRLPVNVVKIDRSFVEGIETERSDAAAIVQAIVALAHTLGMEVVAEGVETTAQRTRLMEFGCDHAQGFLFSAALPAERATELLANSSRW